MMQLFNDVLELQQDTMLQLLINIKVNVDDTNIPKPLQSFAMLGKHPFPSFTLLFLLFNNFRDIS